VYQDKQFSLEEQNFIKIKIMSNSIGNLKNSGLKGNNWPWQYKMLQGQQCACDYLKDIDLNTDQIEPLLTQILAAIQNGTDYEAALVVDANDVTWLEIRIWNGTTFDPPIYFEAGNNATGTPAFPITYINPNTYLAQIVSNTAGASTELTLAALLAAFNLEDFATETTLATVVADLALIYTNLQLNTISVANIDTKLTAAARTPGIRTFVNVPGAVVSGLYSFSIANVGSAAGLVDGEVLPAGVTINFDAGALNNTLGGLSFDATGTTYVVTTIS